MQKNRPKLLFGLVFIAGLTISGYYLSRFLYQNPLPNMSGFFGLRFYLAITIATALQLLGHYIRARKSRLLLSVIRPTKVRTLFKGLAIGFLFNSLLPLRLGEFIRAHEIGKSMAISRTVVFCTILIERALDGFILGISALILVGILYLTGQSVAGTVTILAIGLLAVSMAVSLLLILLHRQNRRILRTVHYLSTWFNDTLRDQIRLIIWSAIYGLNLIFTRAQLRLYVVVSIGMWIVYGISILWILIALLPELNWLKQLMLAASSYASVAIPSGSAYLGTFQQSFTRIAGSLSRDTNANLAAAMIIWLVLIIPISLAGAVFIFTRRTQSRRLRRTASAEVMRNKLYRETDITAELSHFLDAYFAGSEINQVLHNYEAHSEFRLVRTFKGGSNAITLLGWNHGELKVQKITLPQYADKLKAQYDWLAERQSLAHIPRVRGEETGSDYYAISIAYHEEYKPFFDFIHSEPTERSTEILADLLDYLRLNVYQTQKVTDPMGNLVRYINTKVIDKVADTATLDPQIATLLNYPTLHINGRDYANFTQIVERVRQNNAAMQELSEYNESPIHGDLTVDNIIVDKASGDYIILDPNNENQVSDPVVDLGKLYQSFHSGYEFLCQLSSAEVVGNEIRFEESLSSKYNQIFEALQEKLSAELSPAARRSLLFHEAVHYCRMLTYRAKINPASLPAFYAVAVRLFNEYLDQYAEQATKF